MLFNTGLNTFFYALRLLSSLPFISSFIFSRYIQFIFNIFNKFSCITLLLLVVVVRSFYYCYFDGVIINKTIYGDEHEYTTIHVVLNICMTKKYKKREKNAKIPNHQLNIVYIFLKWARFRQASSSASKETTADVLPAYGLRLH